MWLLSWRAEVLDAKSVSQHLIRTLVKCSSYRCEFLSYSFVTYSYYELQLADCQTYVKTLHFLHLHYPALVIVPDTFLSPTDSSALSSTKNAVSTSLMVQCIQAEFPSVPVEPVLRKYWNEEAGKLHAPY